MRTITARDLLEHLHNHFPRSVGLSRRRRAVGTILYHAATVQNPKTGILEFVPGTPRWIVRAVVRWMTMPREEHP